METTITISYPQAVEILSGINADQPIAFTARTEVEMRKTGNPYVGKAFKLSRVRGWIGVYEKRVNNALAKEGKEQLTFTAQPRKWGQHVSRALVRHVVDGEERHYLSSAMLGARPMYLLATDKGLRLVGKALFAPFMPAERIPENQGLDKPIYPRDYNLRNVASFTYRGITYRIRQDERPDRIAKQRPRPYIPRGLTAEQIGQMIVDKVAATLASHGMVRPLRDPYRDYDEANRESEMGWDDHKANGF